MGENVEIVEDEGRGERRGVKWKLEETKRQNGWLAALICKSSLSPLLVNHKELRNDFFSSIISFSHTLSPTPPPSVLLQSQKQKLNIGN